MDEENTNQELLQQLWDLRVQKLRYTEQCQFYLSYLANISVTETDDMSVSEFNTLYRMLLDQKKQEKEDREAAMKKAQEQARQNAARNKMKSRSHSRARRY